jgi:tRNA(Arg) A34 adenosine deaminase TadA
VKIPPPAPASNLSEIIAYGFWMRREDYSPSTIHAAMSALKAIAKKASQVSTIA